MMVCCTVSPVTVVALARREMKPLPGCCTMAPQSSPALPTIAARQVWPSSLEYSSVTSLTAPAVELA